MAYILIVDDDPDTLSMARKTLKDAGHCPILAPNVFRALEVLNHQEPDLVLTALDFPDLDGYGLTRAIRKYHPALPVIALVLSPEATPSPLTSPEAPNHPRNPRHPHNPRSGFDAVIRKPFEETEFSDTVNAILDQS